MTNSRAKGKRVELELRNMLRDELGLEIDRNLDQVRNGGADLIGLPGWNIEVKARKDWPSESEMDGLFLQSEMQTPVGERAVLALKVNRRPWKFAWRHVTKDGVSQLWMDFPKFVYTLRESL